MRASVTFFTTMKKPGKSQPAAVIPERTPRERQNLRNPAILANLFRPKEIFQAPENLGCRDRKSVGERNSSGQRVIEE
jgi:hypothetical protein